jgi:cytidine deaminase
MPERHESPQQEQERYLYAYDVKLRQTMIKEAQAARDELAKNHRGFLVGCSVSTIVKNDYGMEEVKTHSAGNFTPEDKKKSPEAKWCAERIAANLALAEKGFFIPAVVTVSSKVDTGEGGQVHDVLHPCPECRALFRHLIKENIMSGETKVANINDADPQNLKMEERSVKELLALYPNDPQEAD